MDGIIIALYVKLLWKSVFFGSFKDVSSYKTKSVQVLEKAAALVYPLFSGGECSVRTEQWFVCKAATQLKRNKHQL